ncbi:MAG TPA: DUF5668 domain-containing protein [Cerasibacillus sp.]|uniref:LiaI-LiaF-like domain-containing protein n=1 Tax=Cerasibacillus sp. TaxID=2498711 RepID=UPI002F420040
MKKQHLFTSYLLIGIGVFFLLRQLKVPIFTDFYSWPTFLIIIGFAFLIYSFKAKEYGQLFTGTFLLGLGIHFHGVKHYDFWIDHWAMYVLILGIAFFVRFLKTKEGLLQSVILSGFALFMIYSNAIPLQFPWMNDAFHLLETYWPVALIITGLLLLLRHK